jgi:isopenicillin N synthase-like dioxygenase|tara:strand:- start:476 stop:1423 length:948 start_codon:yes stop_codon:yes gene_type:complete
LSKKTQVPVIDFKEANNSDSQLKLLNLACRDHGFFLLKNHGMQESIDRMWTASERFFSLPRNEKLRILRTEHKPLGYYDRELTKRKRDLKEVFDFMDPKSNKDDYNQWPQDESFKQAMNFFFNDASLVANQTLDLVFRSLVHSKLDLPSGNSDMSTVRLNYYPVSDPLKDDSIGEISELGEMALNHHTDPGILTLLLQDMTGGLQTFSRQDGWIDIVPKKDTIVVNLGDAMQVWTNDQYLAAMHRVSKRTNKSRYSTPYFYNPSRGEVLKPIKGISEEEDHYSSFIWKDYIQGRVDDNYSDLGEDDIQISKFRIT